MPGPTARIAASSRGWTATCPGLWVALTVCGLVTGAVSTAGCGPEGEDLVEEDLGPLEDVLDPRARIVWPGREVSGDERIIPRLNGFANGSQVAYWFAGLAAPTTADSYWFCREGDSGCPVDARGAIDFERTVGGPVFARIPGENSYSPYWWIKVIRVPDDYRADSIKSVRGIDEAVRHGRVRQEWYHFSFAGSLGPQKAIQHALLVLAGTALEGNGADLPGQPGTASLRVPVRQGWHKQYRVHYYDFTDIEGVLPPADIDQEEWSAPAVPVADMLILSRDCVAGAASPACQASDQRAGLLLEDLLEIDLTADGDWADTNAVLAALPRRTAVDRPDVAYSPSWAALESRVAVAVDAQVQLIDSHRDDSTSDIADMATIADMLARGELTDPAPIAADRFGMRPIGVLSELAFLDCPVLVADDGAPPAN